MDIYQVIKKPLITEKANLLKESGNQFCLQVDRRANKVEIPPRCGGPFQNGSG